MISTSRTMHKYIKYDHRARDLPHGAWVSINFRAHGGGKRARGAKKKDDEVEQSRDDIIDDIVNEINELSLRSGSLTGDSVLLKIGQNIANIVTQASNNPRSVHAILQSMSRESLVKICGSLDASSSDLKLNTLKNMLFNIDLEAMRSK